MANIDIFGSTRKSFQAKEAFNVHPTTKHHKQDPFPDQLTTATKWIDGPFTKPTIRSKNNETFGVFSHFQVRQPPPPPMINVGKSGLNFLFSVIHTTLN